MHFYRSAAVFVLAFLASCYCFAQNQAPVPLIEGPLVPGVVAPGGADFVLTVKGVGFQASSLVQWNGSVRTTQYVDPHTLTATILANDIGTPGERTVTVVNPGSGVIASYVLEVVGQSLPSISFSSSQLFTSTATAIRVADVNNDGKLDMIWSSSPSENTFNVNLGNGDGTFSAPIVYSGYAAIPIIADFNGDGAPDMVLVGAGSNEFRTVLGNGDGTFQPAIWTVGSHMAAESAVVGDFNNDGNLDVAMPDSTAPFLHLFLGNGDGTFQEEIVNGSLLGTGALAIGDFNADGNLDLAEVSNSSAGGQVLILLGDGKGGFSQGPQYSSGLNSIRAEAVDLNQDGVPDLVVLNSNCFNECQSVGSLSVYIGNSDGSFQPRTDYQLGFQPADMVIQDMNGDGIPDVLVSDSGDGFLWLLEFGPNGALANQISFQGADAGDVLAVGDFNEDGLLDVLLSAGDDQSLLLTQSPLQVSPSAVNFGVQLVGTKVNRSIVLQDAGKFPIVFNPVFPIAGTGATSFGQTNNCQSTLNPGQNCTVTVTAKPVSTGLKSAYMSATNVSGPSANLSTTGSNLSIVPAALNFGSQKVGSTGQSKSVTLKNSGSSGIQVTSISVAGTDRADFFETRTCGSQISAGQSCTVTLRFHPTTTGQRTAKVFVQSNDAGGPRQIQLFGVGKGD